MDFQPSDLVFLAVILWIVLEILNDGGWGGGRRSRVDTLDRVPAECTAA
jgi:hypothetical protein